MGLQEPANINKSVYPKEYQILYKNPIPQKFIATKLQKRFRCKINLNFST
jgi:hypothetical protein